MRIQCNVCEAAEANVMCCADEAALCWSCDEKVHAANKLASKHRRVRLTNSSARMPKCDICQEAAGYFFCLEDRALLCRECDIAIHTANEFVATHHRFLLTGVRIETEPTEAGGPSSTSAKIQSSTNASGSRSSSASAKPPKSPVPFKQTSEVTGVPHGISYPESTPATHLNELFGLTEFSEIYNRKFEVCGMELVQADCSASSQAIENEPDIDECFCKVPDITWKVPKMPSEEQYGPFWVKNARDMAVDGVASVPDVSFLPVETPPHLQPGSSDQWQFYF